jgi:CBS domain-containing protein
MTERERERQTPDEEVWRKRESGQPGGGQGRVDEVGGSGVHPASGPLPAGDAAIRTPAAWGQGERGAARYQDHGESELHFDREELRGAPGQCRDVMTKDPVCCLPSHTADGVAQVMASVDIGPVPIVESQQTKRLIGIVTDRDLIVRVVAAGRDPTRTTVGTVMTRDLVTCHPDDDLQDALRAMAQHQVRRIPVVDDTGRIVGIIAQADIATRMEEPLKTATVVEEISQPDEIRLE